MENKPIVVAFIGKRGSGKSSAAQALKNHGFVDVKFADPLKNMLRAFFYTLGLSDEDTERYIEGDLKETPTEHLCGRSTRHAMQKLGTEWRDMIDTCLWSEILYNRVVSGECGPLVVVTDYRFPHEGEVLERIGAHVVKIEGRGETEDAYAQHASETEMDKLPFDHMIVNDGTMLDLRIAVLRLAKEQGWITSEE